MAITQEVQDLNNYPGNIKRVVIDVSSVVPTGAGGDEKLLLTASTTAYSDNTSRTAIQNMYITSGYVGWAKSSGLAGSAGKFALDSTHNRIGIAIDATVSGTFTYTGKNYYEITLAYNADSTPKSGESIALDMQTKLRAIVCDTQDAGFQLAYKNSNVVYTGGKFWISSGTMGASYAGSGRTSVAIAPGTVNDCSAVLGLLHPVTSENIASGSVAETLITSNYTTNTATLAIGANTGVQAGDAMYITDGTNSDYFTAITVSGTNVTVPTSGANSFVGIAHNYTTANASYVQVLRKQDPDVKPNSYFSDIDSMLRYMSTCVINQIDFSS